MNIIDSGSKDTNLLHFKHDKHESAVLLEIAQGLNLKSHQKEFLSHILVDLDRERDRRRELETEILRLRNELEDKFRPDNIIGNSNAMRDVYQKILQIRESDIPVLIRGEIGTGKDLVASAIHYNSLRAQNPFVKVNCAVLNENLIETELFGYEKRTFSDSMDSRIGCMEKANRGTLFLDEIGDLPLSAQVRLLRVLSEREYQYTDSNNPLRANIRIIVASNKNLEKKVEEGSFRQDLYYRINGISICLPPLRKRKDDILLLADHFVEKYSRTMGKHIHRISTIAIDMMMAYHWPGNVREMENCIEHAVLLSTDGVIHGYNLPPTLQMPDNSSEPKPGTFTQQVELLERDLIVDALKRVSGNVTAAARVMGITPRIARYKIKKLGIEIPDTIK